MDIIKEGTHTYLLRKIEYKNYPDNELQGEEIQEEESRSRNLQDKRWFAKQNENVEESKLEYYLFVEYEILKRNSLGMLVPVQLREQDEKKVLLFDITEKRALKMREKVRGLSKEFCRNILQSIVDLIEEIDEYMLDLNGIEFSPEYIYESMDGIIQWIYFPNICRESDELINEVESLQNKVESLFEWILTQIDYEDDGAVRFIYEIYNDIRKLGFSKELLERHLYSGAKREYREVQHNRKEYNKDSISYEEFFKADLQKEKQENKFFGNLQKENPGEDKSNNKVYGQEYYDSKNYDQKIYDKKWDNEKGYGQKVQNQKVLYVGLNIVLGILFVISTGLEAIWVFYGMTEGFTKVLFRYSVGGTLIIAALLFGILKCFGKLKQMKNLHNDKESMRIDMCCDTEEGGTTILNSAGIDTVNKYGEVPTADVCPMLRDMDTGIVYMIKRCPFYIGSAEGVNQLTISDKTVSREHAVILENIYESGEEGYILRDLHSTNGTWLNGKRMKSGSQKELRDDMVICFAKKEYKFLLS